MTPLNDASLFLEAQGVYTITVTGYNVERGFYVPSPSDTADTRGDITMTMYTDCSEQVVQLDLHYSTFFTNSASTPVNSIDVVVGSENTFTINPWHFNFVFSCQLAYTIHYTTDESATITESYM